MTTPAQTLTLWGHAWVTGAVPTDDALDALREWSLADCSHNGLEVLTELRARWTAGAELRLVLPAAGDVRGLPVNGDFAAEALEAGGAVLLGTPGQVGVGFISNNGCQWHCREAVLPSTLPSGMTLGEAEFELREATRAAAAALTRFNAIDAGDPHAARTIIDDVLADYGRHLAPPTVTGRAQSILDTADRVEAILTAAQRFSAPVPASAAGAVAREDSLRPLSDVVRRARLSAVNAVVRG